jgi:2'-5' RNA ligase
VSERIRSFIAVKLPSDLAERIGTAQERLRGADENWKWVDPKSFHMTLKFLGAVERSDLDTLWKSVCEELEGSGAFTASFRGVGAFPNPNRARVVWVGVAEGAPELVELASRVEGVCVRHGFEREKRPFHAHLTLGRARRPGAGVGLGAEMKEMEHVELGSMVVDRVLLMKSELTRAGAIYSILEEQALERRGRP